jgi:hypothetical protein
MPSERADPHEHYYCLRLAGAAPEANARCSSCLDAVAARGVAKRLGVVLSCELCFRWYER